MEYQNNLVWIIALYVTQSAHSSLLPVLQASHLTDYPAGHSSISVLVQKYTNEIVHFNEF